MLGLQPGERALVIGAHPDDESLGMGGTIAALTAAGIAVDVLAVACVSEPMHGSVSDAATRAEEFADACDVLGVDARAIAWIDDGHAQAPGQHLTDLVTLIESGTGPSLATSRPAALFIPAGGHHQDHQAVHQAALAAVRPGPRTARPLPRVVCGFEGPEDRAWLAYGHPYPLLIDITAQVPAKTKALNCYTSQLRPDPHPRSITKIAALDQAAGAAIGADAAEGFAVYRMVA